MDLVQLQADIDRTLVQACPASGCSCTGLERGRELRLSISAATIAQQTAPNQTTVAAITLQAKASGIFEAFLCAPWSPGTAGQQIGHSFQTNHSATPGALTGGAAAGIVGSTAGPNAQGMIANADFTGAAGLQWKGANLTGSAGAQFQGSQQAASVAGMLTANANSSYSFNVANIMHSNPTGAKTPFPVGDQVVFYFFVLNPGVVTYGPADFLFSVKKLAVA